MSHTLRDSSMRTGCRMCLTALVLYGFSLCSTRVRALTSVPENGPTLVTDEPTNPTSIAYSEGTLRSSDPFNKISDYVGAVDNDDYYDYYMDVPDYIVDQIGKSTIRKCHCGLDNYWQEGKCHSGNTSEIVSGETDDYIIFTSQWKEVLVRELECPAPNNLLTLDENYFVLMTDGRLKDYQTEELYSTDLYCLDHVPHATHEVALIASVCLPPPVVPFCHTSALPEEEIHGNTSGVYDHEGQPSLKLPLLVHYKLQEWDLTAVHAARPTCDMMERLDRIYLNGTTSHLMYVGHGHTSLVWKTRDHVTDTRPDSSFCLQREREGTTYEALVCSIDPDKEHESLCSNSTCVRKCCDRGLSFSVYSSLCEPVELGVEWQPVFQEASPGYTLITGFPLCHMMVNATEHEDYVLHRDGTLVLPSLDESYSASEYCLDHTVDIHGSNFSAMLVTCARETCPDIATAKGILLLISCVFLLVTIGVYASISELRGLLPSRFLLCYATSLFLGFLGLAIVQLAARQMSKVGCIVAGMTAYFGLLAAYFWSNVMSFDLWWALRRMLPPQDSSSRRLRWYCVYSWGIPSLLMITALVIEFQPKRGDGDSPLVRPGFGTKTCWFEDNHSTWIYFFSFLLILLLINALLFVHVIIILARAFQLNTKVLAKQYKERVWLYMKLFVIMGLAWINELVLWYSHVCYLGLVVDVFNSLQGVFIFIIFVGKPSTLALVKKRAQTWRKWSLRLWGRGEYETANGNPSRKLSATTTITMAEYPASRVSGIPG
ncbi:uncharacterized protein LOC143036559 [Oratosquilla oratoria]|uniref:uncharacterized protein LOC143036559 n=1 Tax=Oratosquilla oratoria TaxID=337810 RepID=UPI003F76F1C6